MLSELSDGPTAPVLQGPLGARMAAVEGKRPVPARDNSSDGARRLGGLVLTRHLDESIMIGLDVEVQVVGIKSGTVRLKIVAPRSIGVHRREVFDAIQAGVAPKKDTVALPSQRPANPPRAASKPPGGLVLARTHQQSIMIGDDVEIAVVEVRPSTVKLKIVAPKTTAVHRREVFDAIQGDLA